MRRHVREADVCTNCRHERKDHFLEAGACWHMRGEKLGIRCSCQRFKSMVKA